MSFHVAAYFRSVPVGAGYTELLPVTDAELTINPATTRFWASSDLHVFAVYAGGSSLTRARLSTPWRLPTHIRPISASAIPASVPSIASWLNVPIVIPATHELILDAGHGSGAAQDVVSIIMLTSEGLEPRPPGSIQVIRGTVSGAAPTPNAWSEITVTWEYALQPGPYAIIGSECISTTGIAHRWILEGSNWRPGALSQASVTTIPSVYQMQGVLGNWGNFQAPLMPRLEVLCGLADATHTVFLQVIPLF